MNKIILVTVSLLASVVFAAETQTTTTTETTTTTGGMSWTAQLDARSTTSDSLATCTGTCSAQTQLMFAAGATTKFDLGNNFGIRTGGLITQRGYKQTTAGTDDTVNFTYVDVPVLPEYQINEAVSAYAGVVLGVKATRTCGLSGGGSCSNMEDKSLVTPFQVGANYSFTNNWKANLTYETGSTLTKSGTSEVKTANAIAIGGGYSF